MCFILKVKFNTLAQILLIIVQDTTIIQNNQIFLIMALIHSFEKSGNTLFRNRGQMPVILFILAIPVIYFTDYSYINNSMAMALTIAAIVISFIWFCYSCICNSHYPKGTSGRNTNEQVAESLNTSGIYSMLRHPLLSWQLPVCG